jgi:glutamate--cysteine ligase
MLWASSMPCRLPAEDEIPIGYYGSSNVGQAKSVYRMGLAHRYGRRMQTISGIHYNWSMPGVGNGPLSTTCTPDDENPASSADSIM